MFVIQDKRGSVEIAFTDRHGGISGGPYASLNLASATGEPAHPVGDQMTDPVSDPASRNVEIVASALAQDPSTQPPVVVGMRQVHGSDVHVVDARHLAGPRSPVEADALVTAVPGVALMVRVADCVPILLADTERGVVAAAHAGRSGMVAGVVANTVSAMRELGADRLVGWVGPHVCGRCYEVPEEMRAEVTRKVPAAFSETGRGTASLDLGAGVRAQLDAARVDVEEVGPCTLEGEDFFSYRRQGRESGRQAGLVWIRP